MAFKEEIRAVLDNMILSASGWRGVFGAANHIEEAHRIICAGAAYVFTKYLKKLHKQPLVLLGTDTRPTGEAMVSAMIPVLIAEGCEVLYAGITAAPEIMAWAGTKSGRAGTGFIYISASHNPIEHNGIKFGLTDGGVLDGGEAVKLIADFRAFLDEEGNIKKIEGLLKEELAQKSESSKNEAYKAYCDFSGEVAFGHSSVAAALKEGLAARPLGVVCDFNGSARTVSIDKEFFASLGLKFESINDKPGQIVHRIVPEGESLIPCEQLLEDARKRDPSFLLGYVPDCDGDRGNLVIWDEKAGKARALEAQEVFALACVAELSHLVFAGESLSKAAVVVNDPTSMRIDRIAEVFGVEVVRAEVGEANVVGLARKKREEGYTVRIIGEGSAGGNITHPSAVRDPLHTVVALVKLLSIRSQTGKQGFFEIWRERSGQKHGEDFSLADIIASLPKFVTTSAYSQKAVLQIKTKDHSLLKDRYQKVFLRDWEQRKGELKSKFGICSWEAVAYNGLVEKRGLENFGAAGKGGLKLLFFNESKKEVAYIWMRGSATEPVFRIMVDIEGNDDKAEQYLIDWQQHMIMEADK
jgi:phosphoglucomutase